MTDWAKLFGPNAGVAPAHLLQSLRAFTSSTPIVDVQRVSADGGAWRIEVEKAGFFTRLLRRPRSVQLFAVADPGVENCLIVYRAKLKSEGMIDGAYLEMWCRCRGREFFSKSNGIGQVITKNADWTTLETPFLLRQGEAPDLIRLNVAAIGSGTVWARDVELVWAPLQNADHRSGS